MGHMGVSKTKEMLRRKYWFPEMNRMIEDIVGKCFDCQVATQCYRSEPLKMTEIPEEPWSTVAMDFRGPYPDGHYNLVMIDKRSRYPIVEETTSTNFKQTKRALKGIFATYGTPERIETDGGPPFNSSEFKKFAAEEGFKHHIVTPKHARANGEAERFMSTLNKTERIINRHTKDKDERRMAIQEMLTAYRDTPHIATGATPYDIMKGRHIRTKLEAIKSPPMPSEEEINQKDKKYKEKIKARRENRNTRQNNIILGDNVLVAQEKRTKWTLPFEPNFYIVIGINGSSVTARRINDGRIITRDASKFKIANHLFHDDDENNNAQRNETSDDDDNSDREQIMMDAASETNHLIYEDISKTNETAETNHTHEETRKNNATETNKKERETNNITEENQQAQNQQQKQTTPRR